VKLNYRFRIQPVLVGKVRQFQLRVGLQDDQACEFIPVHQSAFALSLPLEPVHSVESEAHFELTRVLAWLETRRL
jgi:hypothetical protein